MCSVSKKIAVVALGWLLCLSCSKTAQAVVITSGVVFDTTTSLYTYDYTVQNDSLPEDELLVSSFVIPFFGNRTSALKVDSIVAPEFWSSELLDASSSSWPYASTDDPGHGAYEPAGADYTSPDFVLQFSLDSLGAYEWSSMLFAYQDASAHLMICNLGGPASENCTEELVQIWQARIDRYNHYLDASVGGGEALSGFSFDTLLQPTVGPVLLTTRNWSDYTENLVYDTADLPTTYGLVAVPPSDPGPVPEPATILLLGSALASLVVARRRKK